MSAKKNLEILIEVLRKVKLFSHISPPVIEPLANKMSLINYTANQPVFNKGDVGDSLYFIVSGNVKLHEEDMTIAEMKAGDFFGEFSLLDNEPRSLSVTCTVDSVLAALHRNDFYQVINDHPESTKNIIEALIKRIRDQNNKVFGYLKGREKELADEVERKTLDLQKKNNELVDTLEKLKITQQQLVMKEMLASLGQLTAGIAHTIKNPLNFVHNFAVISTDLIGEILVAKSDDERKTLLSDLKQNLEKINSHGMRANSIVENMLQHSVIGSGEKYLVNINELAESVAHIAYKTFQSGMSGFSCDIQKELGTGIPDILISAKEISRVLLNILNNAFYSTNEKFKHELSKSAYLPVINIRTRFDGKCIIISIKDNGLGIPKELQERIFEPFFTTKISVQSNGLGLSMSNEIIKMYKGEIKLTGSTENNTEFVITLPANQ